MRKVLVTHTLDTDRKKLLARFKFLPEFRERMLSGRKIMSTRTKKKAEVGDEFEAFGARFAITGVCRTPLRNVAKFMYVEEGFDTEQEFLKCWHRIYPAKGFTLSRPVWIHRFRRVE